MVNAAHSAGFSCNDYAFEILSHMFLDLIFMRKGFWSCLQVFESFGGFSKTFQNSFTSSQKVSARVLMSRNSSCANLCTENYLVHLRNQIKVLFLRDFKRFRSWRFGSQEFLRIF